ncbi:MAG: hypothetical protein F8N15_09850 [Methanobacterium sp.]|nr:hypothetical protein [Methanobacterium sp.]
MPFDAPPFKDNEPPAEKPDGQSSEPVNLWFVFGGFVAFSFIVWGRGGPAVDFMATVSEAAGILPAELGAMMRKAGPWFALVAFWVGIGWMFWESERWHKARAAKANHS